MGDLGIGVAGGIRCLDRDTRARDGRATESCRGVCAEMGIKITEEVAPARPWCRIYGSSAASRAARRWD